LGILKGYKAPEQERVIHFMAGDLNLLHRPLDGLRQLVTMHLAAVTSEQLAELRKLYEQCGLDPDTIPWSASLTRAL
jgi:hypothetical protein